MRYGIILFLAAGLAAQTVRVNCGGPEYTDAAGAAWEADGHFTGGSTWDAGISIPGTPDPTIYRTQRWGSFTYAFTVPNGEYLVTLRFAETYFWGPGQRVFDVAINGAPALTGFDVFVQAGGARKPVDKTIPVTVTDGQVAIAFIPGPVDSPMVEGIEIVAKPVEAPAFPFTVGAGLLKVELPGRLPEVMVHSAFMTQRVGPPSSSADSCPGTNVWALDQTYAYACRPTASGALQWVRWRVEAGW